MVASGGNQNELRKFLDIKKFTLTLNMGFMVAKNKRTNFQE